MDDELFAVVKRVVSGPVSGPPRSAAIWNRFRIWCLPFMLDDEEDGSLFVGSEFD